MVAANGLPPLEAAYHRIFVPIANKFATVGDELEQKLCAAVPIGVAGIDVVVKGAIVELGLVPQPLVARTL